ncbi:MAG: hypothetical protein GDA51_06435 [Ekhidna sp.]|nr:hypothetical protein [Ekhidna sp.]
MSTLNKKRSKDIMNTENTLHTLPKGLYKHNLMPPPPFITKICLPCNFDAIHHILRAGADRPETLHHHMADNR